MKAEKRCTKCKKLKSLDEFYFSGSSSDGLDYACKSCKRAYEQTEKGRASRRKYKQSEKGQAGRKKWEQSEVGKVSHRAGSAKYHKRYPDRRKARQVAGSAIKSGRLTKPNNCSNCNESTKIEAHHPDYSKPLEVVWLCVTCHIEEHRNFPQGR
jgi:hypothetical protein